MRGRRNVDCRGLAGAENSGTRLLAGELTEEAESGAVSGEQAAATIAKTD